MSTQADDVAKQLISKYNAEILLQVDGVRDEIRGGSVVFGGPLWPITRGLIMRFAHIPLSAVIGILAIKLGPVAYTIFQAVIDNKPMAHYKTALNWATTSQLFPEEFGERMQPDA